MRTSFKRKNFQLRVRAVRVCVCAVVEVEPLVLCILGNDFTTKLCPPRSCYISTVVLPLSMEHFGGYVSRNICVFSPKLFWTERPLPCAHSGGCS